jgi:hypothetical protein
MWNHVRFVIPPLFTKMPTAPTIHTLGEPTTLFIFS